VFCGQTIHPTATVSDEGNRKCPPKLLHSSSIWWATVGKHKDFKKSRQ